MKNICISLIVLLLSIPVNSQTILGTWTMLDGIMVLNFKPDGKLIWVMPQETLTQEEKSEMNFIAYWKIENDLLHFTFPDEPDTNIVQYKIHTDSALLYSPQGYHMIMYRVDTVKSSLVQIDIENFLTQNKDFIITYEADTIITTFIGHQLWEDGFESGSWETFWFYGMLFLMLDYGDADFEVYRIRKLYENGLQLSTWNYSAIDDADINKVIFFGLTIK